MTDDPLGNILNFIFGFIFNVMNYFGRYRLINDRLDDEPYLERYYLFLKNREEFPFNIFLHKFLKSDPDDLHDHPWNYRTFILWGGYWEYTKSSDGKIQKHWRCPLHYRFSSAKSFHRIELDKNRPICWTLFIPGKKIRDWGFNTKDGWVKNDVYLENKKKSK